MARLLIVDDEPTICWALERIARDLGHLARSASSAEDALAEAQQTAYDLIVLDVRLPGIDGLTALPRLQQLRPHAPIIIITAYGDLATAVEAVRGGAFEYLVKPFDATAVERIIERALHKSLPVETPLTPAPATDEPLIGTAPAMQQVFKQIALAAASEASVHLAGESGTGKELVARAIHRYSPRSRGPFVVVHVAGLSASLAESELFGHVRGSFTGADHDRIGLLEQADGGTLLLDEVADIPLLLQVKLLRALEHREVVPVGGNVPRQVDFRVLSATHRNLEQEVAEGRFRHDLFYRLNTFQIRLPALRERGDDLRILAEHFVRELSARSGRAAPALSIAALEELGRRRWPGNVRELRNAIEHALVMARGGAIDAVHLPEPMAFDGDANGTSNQTVSERIASDLRDWTLEQWETASEPRELYERLLALVEPPVLKVSLERHHGQCAAAARSLGLHRITLRKKLDRFGISVRDE
jgi:two-component system nitrogen regulation response regulator GlnG